MIGALEMANVKFEHVSKNYEGKVQAVDDFSLDIADREFIAVIGPSGCGKTTLIRLLAGLEKPDQGKIYINDKIVNDTDPKDRNLALINQTYALYPHLTVYRNLAFPLEVAKVPVDEIDRRVYAAARLLELEPILRQKPKTLSGGQMQRVAIGRSLVRKPQVFLMDEPFSNLDPQFRSGMRQQILRLHEHISASFLFVTHDQQEAMTLADRIVVMKEGKIQQVDLPENIFSRPANMFVADFFGNSRINYMNGILEMTEDGPLVKTGKLTLPLPVSRSSSPESQRRLSLFSGKSVVLGIRPEDFTDRESALANPKHPKVTVITGDRNFAEGENYYHAELENNRITIRLSNTWQSRTNEPVQLAVIEDHIQLFDPQTQLSLLD